MTRIILLTQASCGSCEQAKISLARLALEFPLEVEEIPLGSETGRALALRHAVAFAPGVLVDDALFSYGRLPEKKLRHQLSQLVKMTGAARTGASE